MYNQEAYFEVIRISYNMGNLAKGVQDILPEFQKFLVEKALVPEKNVQYFAHWVNKFLLYIQYDQS